MKPILTFPLSCIAAFVVTALPARTAETPINELLRDALYLEEVSRDSEGAAKQYAEVISRYEAQRDQAATALFRLAEVRRKQGRKDDAITLYQRLITEFPNAGVQIGLAKENLASLGGKPPAGVKEEAADPEAKLIAEYEELRKTSPDLANRPIHLSLAVKNNYFRVVKVLLDNGMGPDTPLGVSGTFGGTPPKQTALALAASQGNLAMCELLISAGAKMEPPGLLNPLSQAIFKGYPKVVEFLLSKGAKPNVDSVSPDQSEYEGTPLAIASRYGHEGIMDQLFEAGADPNLSMPASTGITPLHLAILHGNEATARKLIAAGARMDLPAKEKRFLNSERIIYAGATPLTICVSYGSQELLELMVSKSTKEDLSALLPYALNSPEKFKWLLNRGADPNTRGADNIPILIPSLNQPELARALLEAGADPNLPGHHNNGQEYSPLLVAVELDGQKGNQLTRMMIDAGAKPDEAWMKKIVDYLGDGKSAGKELIFKRFAIPEIAKASSVTAVIINPERIQPFEIATRNTGEAPGNLARLLLQPTYPILWMKASRNGKEQWPEHLTVWRKEDGATKSIWRGRITGPEEFPQLQWGDVLQLSFDLPPDDDVSSTSYSKNETKLPFPIHWALRKRVSFPIQVEVDGKTQTYQMRGDRIAFDPTKLELPLVESDGLPRLLCPDFRNVDLVITRKDSPEIRTSSSGQDGSIPLKANDHVKLIGKESRRDGNRKTRIEVRAIGLPLIETYAWEKEMPTPSLVQVLADILSYQLISQESEIPDASQIIPWTLESGPYIRSLWKNPDLSKIRIHRLKEDGNELVMDVNLTKQIDAFAANDSSVEPTKADILLQRGDIVEILIKGDSDHSWNGLSQKETEFFRKILNCRVQVTDKNRKISVHQLIYTPLKYVETEAGKLPIRTGGGAQEISTMTPSAAFGYFRPTLIRNGVSHPVSSGTATFLQEGDQISSIEDPQPMPRVRIFPSSPRH